MVFSMDVVLLVTALCLDSFVAAFALGTQHIKIPPASAVIISLICSGMLAVSLFFGAVVRPFLPPGLAGVVSFLILTALGVTRLLDSVIKNLIRRSQLGMAKIRFKFLSFSFILRIYADNAEADSDHSKVLAPMEAAPLSLALSVDGLAAGFGAGLLRVSYPSMLLLSFVIDLILVVAGSLIGHKIASKTALNLSWLSGAVLVCLGISKLFQ